VHAPRLPVLLTTALILGAGLLMLLLGSALPLLVSGVGLLIAGLLGGKTGNISAWISTFGSIAIFLAGTPLAGSPPEGLLITAVMAVYFICWVQQMKNTPLSPLVPTGPITLAFYGTLLLAYLLLKGQPFLLPFVVTIFIATLFILINLALWEMGRRSRLTQAAQVQSPSLPDWLGRACVMAAILLGTFLLFRLPLPWIANRALDVADEMNLTYNPPSQNRQQSDRDRPLDGRTWQDKAAGKDGENAGQTSNDGPGSENGESWKRSQLPKQADLELSDVARCHLKILDEAEEKKVLGRPLYLRSHTLSVYQDNTWLRGAHEGSWIADDDDGKTDGWVTMNQAPEDQVIHQRLYLYNHLRSGPLLGMPNLLAFKGSGVFRQSDDFFSFRKAGDVTYEMVSAPTWSEEVMKSRILEAGPAPAQFLERAQGLTFRDIDNILLAPIQKPDRTLKQKLAYLRRLFQEKYTYSTQIENPGNHDPLANFLLFEKRGYCDFYAQAGAHLLRRIGVPSRVAYGYTGGVYDPSQGIYTFRNRDAHAWTEMFLNEHGWVIFDLVPSGQGAHRPAETSQMGSQMGDPTLRFRKAEEATAERNENRASSPSSSTDWMRKLEDFWILRYLDLILGVVILGLLLTYIIRRWRQRSDSETKNSVTGRSHRREAPGYFRDFCEFFASVGHHRAPGQTLKEYFSKLREAQLFKDEFDTILEYYYKVEYENTERSKRLEKQFQREIREFGGNLRGRTPDLVKKNYNFQK
jgi:hypothetical protein